MKRSNPQDFEGAVDKRTQVSFEGKKHDRKSWELTGDSKGVSKIHTTLKKKILSTIKWSIVH